MSDSTKPLLNILLKTKDKIIFDGNCQSFTSKNDNGEFDILPYHANFITMIKEAVILDKGLAGEKSYPIDKGIVYTMSNKIEVYIGI